MSGNPNVPGVPTKTTTTLQDYATTAVQNFNPINKIHHHLCAFHFYGDDMMRQVETHHYCAHQNEEVRQCLLYDSPEQDARLIGVEYMVSESLFMTLPDKEKALWHSHEYEVKSGVLFMPGMPGPVERMEMDKVAKTYGKTIHFWQVDRGDDLPVGIPQIMLALTRDGQLHDRLQLDVERRFGVSFSRERDNRKAITGPEYGVHPMANGGGKGLKTVLREIQGELPR